MDVVEAAVGHDDHVIARLHPRRQIVYDIARRGECLGSLTPLSNSLGNSIG